MTLPLIAEIEDSTTGITGLGLVEDAELIVTGIRDRSWVDGALGGFGASLDALALAVDPLGTLAARGVAWLMEHVRPLQDALDWLAGNADEIAAQAATWSNVAAFTAVARHELAERLSAEVAGWSGQSGAAYRAHAAEHLTVLRGLSTAAGGVAVAVEGAGLLVGLVRGLVRDLIAQFIGTLAVRLPQWLAMEGLTLGLATPLVAGQVAGLVTRTVNEIQHFVRALLNSLRRLLSKINSLSEIFARLRMLSDRAARRDPTARSGTSANARSTSERRQPRGGGGGPPPEPTMPSKPPSPDNKPRGKRPDAHPTRLKERGLRRENDTADVLARHGFDVEQRPPAKANRKEPDYKLEGTYFDCYAPETDRVENIRTRLKSKVVDDQAQHLVLNMDDTACTMEEVADLLERRPIKDLKEILVVLDNQVIRFYPFSE